MSELPAATLHETADTLRARPVMRLTWEQYDQALDGLVGRLPKRDFAAIVGIARSGLIPAVQLAHRLQARCFGAIDIRRTTSDDVDAGKTEPRIGWLALPDGLAERDVLLVDDVVGGGRTLEAARDLLRKRGLRITTCAVAVNLDNFKGGDLSDLLDSYGLLVHGWVQFPWAP